MNHFRLYPLVKNTSRFLPKPCFYSRSSFNPRTNTYEKGSARRDLNIYQEIPVMYGPHRKYFSLIKPRSSKSLCNGREIKMENDVESSHEILGCGMILLRNYISVNDQVEIVNLCQALGSEPLGFDERKVKLGLHRMLLGPRWSSLDENDTDESSLKPLLVPDKIISLVNSSIQDSQLHPNSKHGVSSVCSKHCIVRFYENTGQLAFHEEHEEDSWYPYVGKGWPVVSIFIGDSAEFFYSSSRNMNETNKIMLESGDVLLFGNNNRDICHGLRKIIPNSAPLLFLKKSMLKPGLLYLSFREF